VEVKSGEILRRSMNGWMRVALLAAGLLGALPLMAGAPRAARKAQNQALGSVTTVGPVTVNGVPAPADLTIFPGDTLKTADLGSAAFSISGKGSFKLLSNSEIVFPPDPRYTAELKAGSVVMNSFNGATDVSLRVGNYVVAPVIQAQQSTSQVVRHADGSFTVTCLEGSVGLIPLEGATGRVLQSGESVNILPSGELDIARVPGAAPTQTPTPETTPSTTPSPAEQVSTKQPPPEAPVPAVQHKDKTKQYILIGVVAGGAVGIAAGVAGAGHGKSAVSPSVP
jgi:ferric-dicitrate binding protein FerR (iron transport regulator)